MRAAPSAAGSLVRAELAIVLLCVTNVLGACTTADPRFCNGHEDCLDPAAPFCDVDGAHEASGHVARTCIADPFPDGPVTQSSVLRISPPRVELGAVNVGEDSATVWLTVSNLGDRPLDGLTVVADRSLVAIELDCASSLPARSSCRFGVRLTPAAVGPVASSVVVSAGGGASARLEVRATGVSRTHLRAAPEAVRFDGRRLGDASDSRRVVVRNEGNASTTVLSTRVTGPFALTDDQCAGHPLAAGGRCELHLDFRPERAGTSVGSVLIRDQYEAAVAVPLSGEAHAVLAVERTGTGDGSVVATPGAIACGAACSDTIASPTAFLWADAARGSRFTGWAGDCAGTDMCELDMVADRTVVAALERVTHPLSVESFGSGQGRVVAALASGEAIELDCGDTCSVQVPVGETVVLSALPAPRSHFFGWDRPDCPRLDTCELTVEAPVTIRAHFSRPTLALSSRVVCAMVPGELRTRCWGTNYEGVLGPDIDGTIGDDELARAAGDAFAGAQVEEVAAGTSVVCALTPQGAALCRGENHNGTLGAGHTDDIGDDPGETWHEVAFAEPIEQLGIGSGHACALLTSGEVFCWGDASRGQLGYGNELDLGKSPDTLPGSRGAVPVGGQVVQLAATSYTTCALLATGALRCWGWNLHGVLGYGVDTPQYGTTPDTVPALIGDVDIGAPARFIAVGGLKACAILVDGRVRCWGSGYKGTGYGDTVYWGNDPGETPAARGDLPLGAPAVQISVGGSVACALLVDASVKCWGNSPAGATGLADTSPTGHTPATTPDQLPAVQVGGRVVEIAVYGEIVCARRDTMELYCWGEPRWGHLGHGNTENIGDDEVPAAAGAVPYLDLPSSKWGR